MRVSEFYPENLVLLQSDQCLRLGRSSAVKVTFLKAAQVMQPIGEYVGFGIKSVKRDVIRNVCMYEVVWAIAHVISCVELCQLNRRSVGSVLRTSLRLFTHMKGGVESIPQLLQSAFATILLLDSIVLVLFR